MGVKHEDRRETPKAPPSNRRRNVMEKLEEARAERAKVLTTPSPANDAGQRPYTPPTVEIRVDEAPSQVAPRRPAKALARPLGPKTSRRNLLPELTPADFEDVPVPARPIIPRRVTKDGVIEPFFAVAPASVVEPVPVDREEEDAELRAAIAAAFRSFPEEEEPVEEPQRRSRWFLRVAVIIVGVAAALWGWSVLQNTPPQVASTLPVSMLSPASGPNGGAAISPTNDASPGFSSTSDLPALAAVPQPYRISPFPLGPDILSASPVLAMVNPSTRIAAPALDSRIARGTATKLPTLSIN